MSRVKGKNTKPEILVRKYLFSQGFRFRLHNKSLPGKPDIILKKYNTIIFINGCFWHGHNNCKYYKIPKTRTEWWTDKINRNIANDKRAESLLIGLSWKVIKVWGCELKSKQKETLDELVKTVRLPQD